MTQVTKRALAASLKKLLSQKTLDGKKLTELKQPLLLKLAEQGALKKASGTVVGELLAKYGIV